MCALEKTYIVVRSYYFGMIQVSGTFIRGVAPKQKDLALVDKMGKKKEEEEWGPQIVKKPEQWK